MNVKILMKRAKVYTFKKFNTRTMKNHDKQKQRKRKKLLFQINLIYP